MTSLDDEGAHDAMDGWTRGPAVERYCWPMARPIRPRRPSQRRWALTIAPGRMDPTRERALVDRARVDASAFGELYDFYLPRIYGFVARRLATAPRPRTSRP